MGKWSGVAALGEMAKGAGQYYGTLASESIKTDRLNQARANKVADLADARAYDKTVRTDAQEYAETGLKTAAANAAGVRDEKREHEAGLLAAELERKDEQEKAQRVQALSDKELANKESDRRASRNADIKSEALKEKASAELALDEKNQIDEKKGLLVLVDQLLGDPDAMDSATGSIQGRLPSVDQDTVDWENNFEGLASKLTMTNLGKMKGILSDSDIKILERAASSGMKLSGGTRETTRKLIAVRRFNRAELGLDPYGGEAGLVADEFRSPEDPSFGAATEVASTRRSQGGRIPRAPTGPAVGTTSGGHRFLGGDPNDQANWEAI